MVKITQTPNGITLTGHANYAPYGEDIVCSAVSALTQTFIASVEQLTSDDAKMTVRSGEAIINYDYKSLSVGTKLLVDSFLLGLKAIADSYPGNVSFDSNDMD